MKGEDTERSLNKLGTSWWLKSRESTYNAGDPGSIPGLQRSPGEGMGNPLQYSCLENPMDRGAWWAIVYGIAETDMTEGLNFFLRN